MAKTASSVQPAASRRLPVSNIEPRDQQPQIEFDLSTSTNLHVHELHLGRVDVSHGADKAVDAGSPELNGRAEAIARLLSHYLGFPVCPEDVAVIALLLAAPPESHLRNSQDLPSQKASKPQSRSKPRRKPAEVEVAQQKLCGCAPNMLCDWCMPKDYPENSAAS